MTNDIALLSPVKPARNGIALALCLFAAGCGDEPRDSSVRPDASADVSPDAPTEGCNPAGGCSLVVTKQGPFQDPAIFNSGWTSAHYAELGDGRKCILFLFGHAASGDSNNSIRCLDTSTGELTFAQPDTENGEHEIIGDGINDRDNHLSLNIPGRGLLVTGGAYLNGKPYTGGFFDYKQIKWTYRNDVHSLFIPPATGFDWGTFNPVMAWSTELDVGFVYGGNDKGGPSTHITLVVPRADGKFDLVPLNEDPKSPIANTPACTFSRNNGVAVGDFVYVAGGRCKTADGMQDVAWFRRFNLKTHVWEQLADVPEPIRLPQVTYDARTGNIIFYGGNGGTGLVEGKSPTYWDGRNEVYVWNVAAGGPWSDLTAEADMPHIQMPSGAFDPNTGWNCYRPGVLFPRTNSTADSSKITCMRLDPNE